MSSTHKEQIINHDDSELSYQKRYYKNNFEHISALKKQHYESNKEKWQNYGRQYYRNRSEELKKKYADNKEYITCECGAVVLNVSMRNHLKSMKHKKTLSFQD